MKVNNEQLFAFMQDVTGKLGHIIEGQENLASHIKAVSNKADEIRRELNTHKDSQDAHGIATASKSYGNVVAWGSLGLAMASLWSTVYGKITGH